MANPMTLAEAILAAGAGYKLQKVLGKTRWIGMMVVSADGEIVARFYQPRPNPKNYFVPGKRGKPEPHRWVEEFPRDELSEADEAAMTRGTSNDHHVGRSDR
jgi:hypothetical protein